jgi:hypothetical protein
MNIAFALLLMCAFCALLGIYRGIRNSRESRQRQRLFDKGSTANPSMLQDPTQRIAHGQK